MTMSDAVLDAPHDLIFSRFPQFALCPRPTPIEAMPRLSTELGGSKLFVNRDECTGLTAGGSKPRKREFLLGEALEKNADILITEGAVSAYGRGNCPIRLRRSGPARQGLIMTP